MLNQYVVFEKVATGMSVLPPRQKKALGPEGSRGRERTFDAICQAGYQDRTDDRFATRFVPRNGDLHRELGNEFPQAVVRASLP